MKRINPFINADMGEGIGLHSFGNDESLMSYVDAINVACGFHAGDATVMSQTIALAKEHDIWSAHILDSLTLQGLADAGWQLTLKKWRTSFSIKSVP